MCLAPLVLIGYLWTVQTSWHQTTTVNAPMIEMQTCERGLGLDGKMTSSGMGALSMQYGMGGQLREWSWTVTPKVGGAYLPDHVAELTSTVNFSLGFQVLAGYGNGRLALEYWHQSNAGLGSVNIGLDLVALQTGWTF